MHRVGALREDSYRKGLKGGGASMNTRVASYETQRMRTLDVLLTSRTGTRPAFAASRI
jgi:hypothetical protein